MTIADKMGRKDIIEVIRVHVLANSPKLATSPGLNPATSCPQTSETNSMTLHDVVSIDNKASTAEKWVISLCETFVTDATGRVFVFATR